MNLVEILKLLPWWVFPGYRAKLQAEKNARTASRIAEIHAGNSAMLAATTEGGE